MKKTLFLSALLLSAPAFAEVVWGGGNTDISGGTHPTANGNYVLYYPQSDTYTVNDDSLTGHTLAVGGLNTFYVAPKKETAEDYSADWSGTLTVNMEGMNDYAINVVQRPWSPTGTGFSDLTVRSMTVGDNFHFNVLANNTVTLQSVTGKLLSLVQGHDGTIEGAAELKTTQNTAFADLTLGGGGKLNVTSATTTVDRLSAQAGSAVVIAQGATLSVGSGLSATGALSSFMEKVSGTGTLQMTESTRYILDRDVALAGRNWKFTQNVQLNGHGWDTDGYTLTVSEGASVTFAAGLKLESEGKLLVKDTSKLIITGTLTMGHDDGNNPGLVEIQGGEMQVGNIVKNSKSNPDNVVTMSGGTLTFVGTSADAASVISGVKTTITGGTLSTAEEAWTIDSALVSLGGVTISGTRQATLNNVSLSGAIDVQTAVQFGGTITYAGKLTSQDILPVEHNGFGTTTKTATVVSAGKDKVTLADGLTWKYQGSDSEVSYADGILSTSATNSIYYIIEGGAADITGATRLMVNASGTLAEDAYTLSDYISMAGKAKLTLTGTTSLDLTDKGTAKGIWMQNGASIALQDAASLSVAGDLSVTAADEKGATLTATGSNNQIGTNSGDFHKSITIDNAAITVDGTLMREYTVSGGSLTVTQKGTQIKSGLSATTDLVLKAGATAALAQADLSVGTLTLGAGAKVTLGTASAHDATLSVTGLTLEGNAALDADLIVSSGATMDFSHTTATSGVLTMGCSVTIGEAGGTVTVVLNSTEIAAIQQGQQLVLIDSVDGDSLDDAITISGTILFKDENGTLLNDLALSLQGVESGTEHGAYAVVVTPEPATATLSLLALAALASRRKRR